MSMATPATRANAGKPKSGTEFHLKYFTNNHWRESDSLKIASQSKVLWDEKLQRDKGITIHQILSEITYPEDIEPQIQHYYNEGSITEGEKQDIYNKINVLLKNEKLSPLFSKGLTILNENEIILPNKETIRPDRVVISPDNKATVIDYKTGKQSPSHIKQIQKYIETLQNMNYQNVRGMLVYLEDNHILEIT